jgi:hypothetical protein
MSGSRPPCSDHARRAASREKHGKRRIRSSHLSPGVSRIDDAKESLLRSKWDLVIVDEAHKMAAYSADKKTLAYKLGEALSAITDHYLLMTVFGVSSSDLGKTEQTLVEDVAERDCSTIWRFSPMSRIADAVQEFLTRHLATVVEDDNAGANEFCAPTEEPARFDIFDNDREAKSIVQRVCNPMMLLRNITEVNSAMVIRHGVIAARIGRPADELKCLARSEVFIGITAAINPVGRFAA